MQVSAFLMSNLHIHDSLCLLAENCSKNPLMETDPTQQVL